MVSFPVATQIGLRTFHNSRPHKRTSRTCYNLMPINVPIIRKPNSASKSWGHVNTKSMIHDSEFPIRKIRPRQSLCCTECIFIGKCFQNKSNKPVGITSVHLMESFVFYQYIFQKNKTFFLKVIVYEHSPRCKYVHWTVVFVCIHHNQCTCVYVYIQHRLLYL